MVTAVIPATISAQTYVTVGTFYAACVRRPNDVRVHSHSLPTHLRLNYFFTGTDEEVLVFVHAHAVGDVQVRHGHCCFWVLGLGEKYRHSTYEGQNRQAPIIATATKSVLQNGLLQALRVVRHILPCMLRSTVHGTSSSCVHERDVHMSSSDDSLTALAQVCILALDHCPVLNGVALLLQPDPCHSLQTFLKKLHG